MKKISLISLGLNLCIFFSGCTSNGGVKLIEKEISGMQTYVLENEFLSVSVIPEAGAKIYNLIFKPTGSDLSWHSPITDLKRPVYGGSFIPYDCGGFDEILPTVGECDWRGVHLPDHGEAWQLPWNIEDKKTDMKEVSIKTNCKMRASPFFIERRITLKEGESRIRLDYKITNMGKKEWEFIWACHGSVAPGGNIGKGDRIFLPAGIKVNVWFSENERMGTQGQWLDWPLAKNKEGDEVNLSLMGNSDLGYAEKLFSNELKEGWCAVGDMDKNEFLAFTFPIDKLPYAGVWINQGGWRGYTQLGLEPTNTLGDALDIAVTDYLKKYDKLSSGESKEFTIYIVVIKGLEDIKSITKDGCFIEKPLVYKKGMVKGKFGIPVKGRLILREKSINEEILSLDCNPYKTLEVNAQIDRSGVYFVEIRNKDNRLFDTFGEIEVK